MGTHMSVEKTIGITPMCIECASRCSEAPFVANPLGKSPFGGVKNPCRAANAFCCGKRKQNWPHLAVAKGCNDTRKALIKALVTSQSKNLCVCVCVDHRWINLSNGSMKQ